MSHIKLIESTQDHELAMARIMSLMDLDPKENSAEADEMDVLALLIEKYEEEQFPIEKPDPIEVIKFRMEQQEMRNRDLVPFIGSAPKTYKSIEKLYIRFKICIIYGEIYLVGFSLALRFSSSNFLSS